MKLKVTVNEAVPGAEKLTYPCAMKNTRNGSVVMFTRYGYGAVMSSGKSTMYVGYQSDGWTMDDFSPFKGTIILECE